MPENGRQNGDQPAYQHGDQHVSADPGEAAQIDAIIARHAALEGPLLPILHALQQAFGHIPQAAMPRLTEALNISRAELHGVISFYHDFRTAPAGRRTLRLCRAEACQARGGAALETAAQKALGITWHGTTPDGAVTLEPVYCLGLCACGPAAMLDDSPRALRDEAALNALISEARA